MAVRSIARASIALNIETSADHTGLTCEMLAESGWQAQEVADAVRGIVQDPEMMVMVRRAGAITLDVFEAWRQKRDTPKTLGPCFTYDCKRPATVAAWGDIYCRPCYERHKQNSDAYTRALERGTYGPSRMDTAPAKIGDILKSEHNDD